MAMFSKLKQYKDLRDQAKTLQSALSQETVHTDAAGGKVQVIMDGNQQITGLDIDAELLQPSRKSETEKAVKDAINSAVKKAQMAMAKKAKEMGNIPGLQ